MINNHQINTVFFDLFGVLLGIDQSVVIQYLSTLTDVPYLTVKEVAMGEPLMKLERGEINFDKYIQLIRGSLQNGARIEKNNLQNIWQNSRVGEMPAVSILDKLKENYSVWVLSNTTENHIKSVMTEFTFLGQVSGVITSEAAGAHKPSPEIFRFALSKAGSNTSSSIFIDDSYTNIKSAQNLGIMSHHYTSFEEFTKFISSYL